MDACVSRPFPPHRLLMWPSAIIMHERSSLPCVNSCPVPGGPRALPPPQAFAGWPYLPLPTPATPLLPLPPPCRVHTQPHLASGPHADGRPVGRVPRLPQLHAHTRPSLGKADRQADLECGWPLVRQWLDCRTARDRGCTLPCNALPPSAPQAPMPRPLLHWVRCTLGWYLQPPSLPHRQPISASANGSHVYPLA